MTAPADITRHLREFLKVIGGRYDLTISGLTGPSEVKLTSLLDHGRPFTAQTMVLQNAILAEWKRRAPTVLSKNGRALNMDPALAAMAGIARGVILRRFDEGGFDVRLRALTPRYAAWKAANGLDPRIGIARGILRRNIQRASFVMRKRSSR